MNIAAIGNSNLTLAVSDTGSMNAIDMAMLKKSLDAVETNGAMITQMMEQSVNPNIGANIDIRFINDMISACILRVGLFLLNQRQINVKYDNSMSCFSYSYRVQCILVLLIFI